MTKHLTLLLIMNSVFAQDHWETAVFANDQWRYLVPSSEPDTDWNEEYFDDSDWAQGPGGFGYGDGDDGTIIDLSLIHI